MARMGYKEIDGTLHLLIVPESGLETDLVFRLIHGDSYPLRIKGDIVLSEDCAAPQIILFGNNVVRKEKDR